MQKNAHQLTAEVKLLQKVVLVHGEKILILRRATNSFSRPNQWDLPGGNSEWPETTESIRNPHISDAVREVKEETGISIKPEDIVHQIHFSTYFDAKKQTYTVILGWKVVLPNEFDPQLVQISDEHSEYTWIEPIEFEAYDFGFAGEKDGFIRAMISSM